MLAELPDPRGGRHGSGEADISQLLEVLDPARFDADIRELKVRDDELKEGCAAVSSLDQFNPKVRACDGYDYPRKPSAGTQVESEGIRGANHADRSKAIEYVPGPNRLGVASAHHPEGDRAVSKEQFVRQELARLFRGEAHPQNSGLVDQ
jgi:hypothetical protein